MLLASGAAALTLSGGCSLTGSEEAEIPILHYVSDLSELSRSSEDRRTAEAPPEAPATPAPSTAHEDSGGGELPWQQASPTALPQTGAQVGGDTAQEAPALEARQNSHALEAELLWDEAELGGGGGGTLINLSEPLGNSRVTGEPWSPKTSGRPWMPVETDQPAEPDEQALAPEQPTEPNQPVEPDEQALASDQPVLLFASGNTDVPPEQAAAAVGTYLSFWESYWRASTHPVNPHHSGIHLYADEPILSRARNVLTQRFSLGHALHFSDLHGEGRVVFIDNWTSDYAEIIDCIVDTAVVYDVNSGAVLNNETATVVNKGLMRLKHGLWKVSEVFQQEIHIGRSKGCVLAQQEIASGEAAPDTQGGDEEIRDGEL